jgi:DNA-binding response OmpR family regulator
MNIAILEDDEAQAQFLWQALTDAGYQCTTYLESNSLLTALQKDPSPDLLVLDWEIPDINGLDVLHWLRSNKGFAVPVVFVTNRTQEADIVVGLEAGADDYMTKPIRSAELLARVAALLRRTHIQAAVTEPFDCGAYRIDPTAGSITLGGAAIELTPKEFDLALLFFRNPGRLFSREALSTAVWNRSIPATSRTLDTHLSNMRQKLALRPENGFRLSSSYALGYRLEAVAA